MSVKLLFLLFYIICNSFKSYWRLVHQHTEKKKGKHFPPNPSSEFRFESRSKDGWERASVFNSTVKFSAFFLSIMTWSNISRRDLCWPGGFCSVPSHTCVHTGSLQQFKIRKHLENMRPCQADSSFSLCTRKFARKKGECVVHHSDLWQYRSLSALSSSMSVLFWFSKTATRFSRHLTYSFFFRRHSRAASLEEERNLASI